MADDRTKRTGKVWLVAGAVVLLGIIGLWAGWVIRVRTADAILIVEVNEPNPDLYVDGEKVSVAWQNGGRKAEVVVKPGIRKVELKKDGFRVYDQELTLERHGRTVLVARLESTTATSPKPKGPLRAPAPIEAKPVAIPPNRPSPRPVPKD